MQKNDIDAVTMPEYKVNQNFVAKLNSAGSVTYVHTINDTEQVANYEKWGVYGVYSDVLTEQELDDDEYTVCLETVKIHDFSFPFLYER